ncbi:hypothetical protein PVL29_017983 [Vitis rotundifolia]|nr:hypothetical protein PVL29_017983 [Vitis rotundifolia]
MADQVKLFGVSESFFAVRVEVALRLKGVQFEYVEEDLYNKSPSLLKYNPVHKKIPVLLHNGNPLAESLVILEYIDETWKHNPIFPKDPYERARARFWAKFIDEKLFPVARKALVSKGEEEQREAIGETHEHLKTLESELKEKKFFGGESWGYLDIAAMFIIWLGIAQEALGVEFVPEEKFPRLHKWQQRLVDEDAVFKECVPREKLGAFFKARFGSSAASK